MPWRLKRLVITEECDRLAALYESLVSRTALLEQKMGSVVPLEEQVRNVGRDHAKLIKLYEDADNRCAAIECQLRCIGSHRSEVEVLWNAFRAELSGWIEQGDYKTSPVSLLINRMRVLGDQLAEQCRQSKVAIELMRNELRSPEKQILIEVSPGELIDKLTILEIKLKNMSDPDKLSNVQREYDTLGASLRNNIPNIPEIADLKAQLKCVNLQLWRIEDEIRLQEKASDFGESFVKLARSVYRTNDRRAAIKRHINDLLKSRIVEEKSYADY
jgi:hypothetical protein